MSIAVITKRAVYVFDESERMPVAWDCDGEPVYTDDMPRFVSLLDVEPRENGVSFELVGYDGDEYDDPEDAL